MRSTSRFEMRRRSVRVLAGGLLVLGLCGRASAELPSPPPPPKSPYALETPTPGTAAEPPAANSTEVLQLPKSAGEPKPPAPIEFGPSSPTALADADAALPIRPDDPKALPNPKPGDAPKPVEPPKPNMQPQPAVMPAPFAPSGPPLVVPPLSNVPEVTTLPRTGSFIPLPEGPNYVTFGDFLKRQPLEPSAYMPFSPIGIDSHLPFDEDYRYIDDPANPLQDWFDNIKRIHFQVRDNWLVSFGGEFRYRYNNEYNSRLSGFSNDYSLLRARVHADIWRGDDFRVFIEFLSADTMSQQLQPLPVDQNPAEILNLFFDYKLLEAGDTPIWVRFGRQELLYGSQRLISPEDWSNSPRTFDGVKFFWHSCNWDVDAFWTKPVVIDPNALDSPDSAQNFSGAWATWKPKKGTTFDFYVLDYNSTRPVPGGRNGLVGGFDITTFGVRGAGDFDGRILYDNEAMLQTGIRAGQEVEAGAFTFGLGYRAKNLPWNPTFWLHDDWASGTADPGGTGKNTTFNQLFPDGHMYLGYADIVGRQNINDFNLQFSLNPQPWATLLAQYHSYTLVSSKDALYDTFGNPIRVSPSGGAGRVVGSEMDLLLNFQLTRHQDLAFGYSQFYSGNFIRMTGNPLDAGRFYGQYSFVW